MWQPIPKYSPSHSRDGTAWSGEGQAAKETNTETAQVMFKQSDNALSCDTNKKKSRVSGIQMIINHPCLTATHFVGRTLKLRMLQNFKLDYPKSL